MQKRTAVAAALVTLLGAGPAGAYVRTTTERGAAVHWRTRCVSIAAHTGAPPSGMTHEQLVKAAETAAAAWSREMRSCTELQLVIEPVATETASVAHDGQNNLVFRKDTWCKQPRDPGEPCYDPAALAITTVFAQQSDGTILDSDIEVNAVNFSWGDLVVGGGRTGAQDLQNTLTHELGHLIGLDHTCYIAGGGRARPVDHLGRPIPDCASAPGDVAATTMFAAVMKGDVQRRTLTADDAQGVCDVYPTSGGAPACPRGPDILADGGGCSYGGRTPLASLAVAAGVALLLRVRRRRGG